MYFYTSHPKVHKVRSENRAKYISEIQPVFALFWSHVLSSSTSKITVSGIIIDHNHLSSSHIPLLSIEKAKEAACGILLR